MPQFGYGYEPIGDSSHHQFLDVNLEDTVCELYGFKDDTFKLILYNFFNVIFLGIPLMICGFSPNLKLLKYKKCDLSAAKVILVKDNHGNSEIVEVKSQNVRLQNIGHCHLRHFYYRHTKYVWVSHLNCFGSLDRLISPLTVDQYLDNTNGLSAVDHIDLSELYGPNKIEIEVKSYWRLFVEEIFNPFFIFQAFSMILWSWDQYYIYATCVLVLTLFSVITALLQTRKQSEALHDLVESSKCHSVTVLRQNLFSQNKFEEIDPINLVPGDLIVLPKADFVLPCDLVLLTGQCIVNESMLTGESVPVTKTALHSCNETYSIAKHKRYTLFCGTHMIQSRYYGGEYVLGRVVRTGFDTTKGALVKSILFPNAISLQFYKDSLKFIFMLFVIAASGMAYCLHLYIVRKATIAHIVIRSLDVITIVVPPALPAAMTVGTVYSQNRLKKLGIFCISPPKINVGGKVKLACFDKTGTLTQDGLDIHSVLPVVSSKFTQPITDSHNLDLHSKLLQAMTTCHSLTQINGRLTGDPLDLSMFEFTKWELEEPGDDETARYDMLAPTVVKPHKNVSGVVSEMGDALEFAYQIGIIRQFPFSSTLQCMSVICRILCAKNMLVFTKGAPEKIASMCYRETLPRDFYERLGIYAAQGFRVIALAYKEMPKKFNWKEAQKIKRDVIESDLCFLGLLIMQNTLKEETTPVIRTLHNANIRTVMITGDNILTAISVARECEIVKPDHETFVIEIVQEEQNSLPQLVFQNVDANSGDFTNANVNSDLTNYHFAIDGKTWDKLKTFYSDLLPTLLVRTAIFARFQPDQKTQLVTYFQGLDYVVSMVGDGANDCGALKAANVGISLSQAEASVAAPFTSSIDNISCIVHLMLEGRCALVTSFAVFKYMALYSLIQFITVLILYKHHSILGDTQFLFIDLVITTVLAITISRQGPPDKLCVKRPPGALFSIKTLIPLFLEIKICAAIQAAALFYLYLQTDWFVPIHDKEEVILSWENTVLFTVSCFQYIILALVYCKGRPYRRPTITNFWFLASVLALSAFLILLMIYPNQTLADFFEIIYLPHHASRDQYNFRYTLLLFPLCHLIISYFIEICIADRTWLKKIIQLLKRKSLPKNKYKLLLDESKKFCYWQDGNYAIRTTRSAV